MQTLFIGGRPSRLWRFCRGPLWTREPTWTPFSIPGHPAVPSARLRQPVAATRDQTPPAKTSEAPQGAVGGGRNSRFSYQTSQGPK